METTTSRFFNRTFSPDVDSLTESLFLHCRAAEDVLMAGGLAPGTGYTALDVVRVAATLMTAPIGAEDRVERWPVPQADHEDFPGSSGEDGFPF